MVDARVRMQEQAPGERKSNFKEVPFGYTPEEAAREGKRCLQCKKPKCVEGCPVRVDIPGFIKCIVAGDHVRAAAVIKTTNTLPAVCGRVCPQEEQCEKLCVLGKKHEPIAIGNLERFAADFQREHDATPVQAIVQTRKERVAIVGAGPAGLTAAGDLLRKGYGVDIYEALHKPGGVLTYGIPEFRLPKAIVFKEVDELVQMGARLFPNHIIGKLITVAELFKQEGYAAVFIGTGAGLPMFLKVEGENLCGVYSANEYLTRSNLMKAYDSEGTTPILRGRRVVTVGGGNVAMDSARTALRLGAAESIIVYRRSREEMPARQAEIHHAEEEGIKFHYLQNPVKIIGDDKACVKAIRCIRMELGAPDESGRRRPVPVAGSEFDLECDTVIVAIGNRPNPIIPATTPGLTATKHGTIQADEATGLTALPGVYAGGDIVTGAATVILAMGAGKTAADSIDRMLTEKSGGR
ncbi:MAG: NADPH-dependent glutamate synthase [Planctomycetota bacterium]